MWTLKNILTYVLLCFVIGLGVFMVYQPHLKNPLPLLSDEYVHISLAKQLLETGKLPFTNPYIATPTPHTNYESGFHFLLALLFTVIPGEPVLIYKYFASLFFVINGLLLFYLVRLWSNSFVIALVALFFFSTIKSTDGLLAHQYFVPLTIGITLLLTSHILLYKFVTKYNLRYLLLLTVSLLLCAVTYPPTFLFFIITAAIYVFSMQHNLATYLNLSEKTFFKSIALVSLLGIVLFFSCLLYLGLLNEIIFHSSWSLLFNEYSPVFYFGVMPSTLALIGVWKLLQTKASAARIILYWFLYSLATLYVFYLTQYSLLIPMPRLFFFYLISVSILAGYGTKALLTEAKTWGKLAPRIFIIFILVVASITHAVDALHSSAKLPTIITERDYNSLIQFSKTYPTEAVVIADALTSVAVYPITGNTVLNVINSNIGGGDSNAVRQFLSARCAEKKLLFERFSPFLQNNLTQKYPFFVISRKPQNCNFLQLLPESNTGLFIYSLKTGTLQEFQHKNQTSEMPSL